MTRPKLRPVETHWVEHRGQPALLLRDPLGLSDKTLLVPPALVTLLVLCDGTRDLATLRTAFELRTSVHLTPQQLEGLIGQFDEALLLVSPRFARVRDEVVAAFRQAPCRVPALAGRGYPADAAELGSLLDGYVAAAFGDQVPSSTTDDSICGLISPHIDFQRGGPIYARAWLPAAGAAREADLVIILGTDHAGGPGQLTLTRQHYATPWGMLPTARTVVDAIAAAIGEDDAFAAELNHRQEHSIELATVWLHYLLGDHCCELVPILCGSFQHFVEGHADPAVDERFALALDALCRVIAGRRTLVVAAADLAHVGPAFGDAAPLGPAELINLRAADSALLTAASAGVAEAFFEPIRRERDGRRICGLPPIYMMLRLLDGARGEVTGYAQCPADAQGGSLVSVGSVIYHHA